MPRPRSSPPRPISQQRAPADPAQGEGRSGPPPNAKQKKLRARLFQKNSPYRAAKRELSRRYFGRQCGRTFVPSDELPAELRRNLVGIGVAEKRVKGKATGKAAITFYVRHKVRDLRKLRKDLRLRKKFKGMLCDVVQVGIIRAAQGNPDPSAFNKRLFPGCQIGVAGGSPGTLGGFVRDDAGDVYLVTNSHVVAPDGGNAVGATVFQPAPGSPGSRAVATVTDMGEIGGDDLDVAFARLEKEFEDALFDIPHVGALAGLGTPDKSENVAMFAQFSGHMEGSLFSVDSDVEVLFEDSGISRIFRGVLALVPSDFADRGDSGAFIVDNDNTLIGLLFAVSGSRSFAIPIQKVQASFPLIERV